MKPNVFILATCRNPDLFRMTELVFKTLRTGFPTADITVFGNGNQTEITDKIHSLCDGVRADFIPVNYTPHAAWIEGLLNNQTEPFWIVDTDVIFWKSIEDLKFDTAMAGRHIPRFWDLYTKCITEPRIHTSLMYVNPSLVKRDLETFKSTFPSDTDFNPLVNMVRPFFHRAPIGNGIFYDCCAMLSYHVSTTRFNEEQLGHFDHLNCGTYADIVEPHGHAGIVERQKAICENPELARGLWKEQEKYYAAYSN